MQLRLPTGILLLFFIQGCGSHDHRDEKVPDGGSVTLWTDETELFMEYPALVVGKESRFAAHLTRLSDFKPFTREEVHFHFRSDGGAIIEQTLQEPSPPGIYRPNINFEKPGRYDLTITVRNGANDTITARNIQVFPSHEDIPSSQESVSSEQLITFLKEQQWKTDFRTEPVRREKISGSTHAAGEIIPKLNSEAIVASPFTGYAPADRNDRLPLPGSYVVRGAILAVMFPAAETPGGSEDFASRFTDAQTARDLAARDYERAKRLIAIQGISEKEFQESEANYLRTEATFNALRGYLNAGPDSTSREFGGGFAVATPISGRVAEVYIVPGKPVNAGEPLFRIINASSVWVRVNIPVTEIALIGRPKQAWMQLSGVAEPYEISQKNGRLISIGSAVDERTRTVPVIFEVQNRDESLRIGMIGEVYVETGEEHIGLVIPESALIEEEGRYSVYVHVEGEGFAKREVQLGSKGFGRIEILNGVGPGERVVSVGAYQVRLASLSSQLPTHGHEH